jgi:Protein of unknown function (DUF1566)
LASTSDEGVHEQVLARLFGKTVITRSPSSWMKSWLVALASYLFLGAAWADQVCDTKLYALSSPTSQFEDHHDGTVTDKKSNLMWMRCSLGQRWANGQCLGPAERLAWAAAQGRAQAVNQTGSHFFNDWRVPSLREMATLAERQCTAPRLNMSIFPDTPAAAYWTNSTRVSAVPNGAAADFAYTVSFADSGIAVQDKDALEHVRLVRNAP